MGRERIEMVEVYEPRLRITELGGFTPNDFTSFLRRHQEIVPNEENGLYPIYQIMRALNDERKKRQHGAKAEGMDDLEIEKKKEEIRKLKIANDEKARELIRRDDAQRRMITTLTAVANKIKILIKQASPKLVLIDNARTIEDIQTRTYNNLILGLKDEATNISWETDGVENI